VSSIFLIEYHSIDKISCFESKLHIRFFLLPPAPCRPPDLNKQFKLRTAYMALKF